MCVGLYPTTSSTRPWSTATSQTRSGYLGSFKLRFRTAKFKGPVTAAGGRQPPVRGFMDDFTITTTSHVQGRWVLKTQGAVASWVRMVFKPRKSRSMVIRKGTLTDVFKLQVQGEDIQIIRENPIKGLGKWYDEEQHLQH